MESFDRATPGPTPALSARPLGTIGHVDPSLPDELRSVPEHFYKGYAEYALGSWTALMLWNASGKVDDAVSREYQGHAIPTEAAEHTPLINEIICANFNTSHLKSARLFRASNNGLIIPHRDYMEFHRGFNRVHVPLVTDEGAFNSEHDTVYRMRTGEIWYVDGNQVHSGGTSSIQARIHLALDFDPAVPFEVVLEQKIVGAAPSPLLVERPQLDSRWLEDLITSLSQCADRSTWSSIVGVLGRVHIRQKTSCANLYPWLMEVARRSGDELLLQFADSMSRYFVTEGPARVTLPQELIFS